LIPGIQGRCQWMAPAIEALSRRSHVLTFSLNDLGAADGFFDRCVARIDALLDQAGPEPAVVAGVSFGGLIAVRYAARRAERTSHLILTSSPSPRWPLDPASARYIERPRLAVPAFALRSVPRLAPEIAASLPTWTQRATFTARHLARVVRYPLAPRHMAAWVNAWMSTDFVSDCRAIRAPTLVITGEASLDRVVPVTSSLDYLQLIVGSQHVVLRRTGHLGLITRPDEYARLIEEFVDTNP
ncbi:MAG TPA: alpha/beta hydrolase, partial [Vicinamibacterales bacterium]|nr:alpha/beta hydrolase [Vicinamibacterales bacterium]